MPRVEKTTTPTPNTTSLLSRLGFCPQRRIAKPWEMALPESEESVVPIGGSMCFLDDDPTAASTGHTAEWTNEKHHLYIGSLERSFLDQLQQYMLFSGSGRTRQIRCSMLEMPSSIKVMPRTKLHRNQPVDSLQKNSKKVRLTTSPSGLARKQTLGSMAEYSDQNFVEEYEEEPKYAPFSKRLKRSEVDASANDQVVPMGDRSFK